MVFALNGRTFLRRVRRLLVEGWPNGRQRIAVVVTARSEHHALLFVDAAGDPYVLDNRTDRIRLWSALKGEGQRLPNVEDAAANGLWLSAI